MFRKYYKMANDDIKPDRELIDRIFEKAETESQARPKAKIYKIGTAVAAVFVVAVSTFLYPQIQKTNQQPIVAETKKNIESKDATEEIRELQPHTEPKQDGLAKARQTTEDTVTENAGIAVATVGETEENTATFDVAQKERIVKREYKQNVENIAEADETEKSSLTESLYANFGLIDEATGNQHIFEITGKFNINIDEEEKAFYVGRWRWFVNGSHSSLLCEFVIDQAATQMYESRYEDGSIIWDETNNLLKK